MSVQKATYWGFVGASLGVLFSFAVLCIAMSPLHDQAVAVWHIATYPVTVLWGKVIESLGNDYRMNYILPMLASQLIFVAGIGFGIGALLTKISK